MGRNKQKCSKKISQDSVAVGKSNSNKRKKPQCVDGDRDHCHSQAQLQEGLLSAEYILSKVFRKDGPPLGLDFDSLPSQAFSLRRKGLRNAHQACKENQRAIKRRKISGPTPFSNQVYREESGPMRKHGIGKGLMALCSKESVSVKKHGIGKGLMTANSIESGAVKKHGIGKGLMTVWRATHPDCGDFPAGVEKKKKKIQQRLPAIRKPAKKRQEKNKFSVRSRKLECHKVEKPKKPLRDKCDLALEGGACQEDLNQYAMLVDDEELELRELQAGPNPLTCSAHFTSHGLHGCSLCKDLLAKFPPNSVAMKPPLYAKPWDSSPELIKKIFKVFHFLCTYASRIGICSFTLDEFAQGFHDKDSLILQKVHVALLDLLLSDVEKELNSGVFPCASKNHKFLGLLHSVEQQDFVLRCWKQALNLMTWAEILRQVLAAAGFGSKHNTLPKAAPTKEANLMANYGLSSGTLKGELFGVLSSQGNNGLKVSELAKQSQIVELDLAATTHDLELLICSTLSSDITLFEKISSSAYRLRINSVIKESENCQSDFEDFGSVDDDSKDNGGCSSTDDSDDDSGTPCTKFRRMKHGKCRNNMLTVYTEIDESHPGEAWLLGLMEGEYSDLSTEEKLNALMALIDLLSAGTSIRMEEPVTSIAESVPNLSHCSGAKIKRSTIRQRNTLMSFGDHNNQMFGVKQFTSTSVVHPVDSLACIGKISGKERSISCKKGAKERDMDDDLHTMQSIFLGFDRRYNKYWLYLGPCNYCDPGHRRIYFESSEDGHWEVIDTEEALSTLLSVLDRRGTREAFLLASLEKREAFLYQAMSSTLNDSGSRQPIQYEQSDPNMSKEDSSSAISDVDNLCLSEIQNNFPASAGAVTSGSGKKGEQQKQRWAQVQAYDAWLWNSFYSELNAVKHTKRSYLDSLNKCEHCHDLYWRDEKHCKICHTTFELDFDLEERYTIHAATCRENRDAGVFPKHKVLSLQLQSLKAALYAIESVMPGDAVIGAWTKSAHNLWAKRLRRTSTLAEFLQVLADFVGAINEDWFYQRNTGLGSNSVLEEVMQSFPIMPQTSSAVALWLVKLDTLIAPHLEGVHSQKVQEVMTKSKGKRVSTRGR